MDSQWTGPEPSLLQEAYIMHDVAGLSLASFPAPGLLHDHVAAHFQGSGAPSFFHNGVVHTLSYDRFTDVDVDLADVVSGTMATPEIRIAHDSVRRITTQSSGDKNSTTCVKCDLTFTRAADLNRHSGIHLPERRKYHCVIKDCKYKGTYRKDKLASHMENRHIYKPRPVTIRHNQQATAITTHPTANHLQVSLSARG